MKKADKEQEVFLKPSPSSDCLTANTRTSMPLGAEVQKMLLTRTLEIQRKRATRSEGASCGRCPSNVWLHKLTSTSERPPARRDADVSSGIVFPWWLGPDRRCTPASCAGARARGDRPVTL